MTSKVTSVTGLGFPSSKPQPHFYSRLTRSEDIQIPKESNLDWAKLSKTEQKRIVWEATVWEYMAWGENVILHELMRLPWCHFYSPLIAALRPQIQSSVPLGWLGDPKRTLEPRPFNKTRSLAVSLSRVTMGHHGSPVVLPSGDWSGLSWKLREYRGVFEGGLLPIW